MLAVRCWAGLVAILLPAGLLAQSPLPPLNLDELRADLTSRLLEERAGSRVLLVDHLWKSNGGVLISRNPGNPAARSLATQLASSLTYDVESETILWPVLGFGNPRSLLFPPGSLWPLLQPYVAAHFGEADVQSLEANFVEASVALPVRVDPLTPPVGLTMPPERLLGLAGYLGTRLFVYSPSNCFDLALKCFRLGLFDDARVLLSHALAQTLDPRYYYFRGTIEMLTGLPDDATMSALGFLATTPVNAYRGYAYERINGPAAIQFRDLVYEWSLR